MKNIVNVITIGDFFDRISSHWCYDTEHFKILQRVYTDLPGFDENIINALEKLSVDSICYSGKKAAENARYVDQLVFNNGSEILHKKYKDIIKVVRIQNTNMDVDATFESVEDIYKELGDRSSGASWLKVALGYEFDIIFVQTYRNIEIINKLTKKDNAIYLPFAYNDRRFYPRDVEKDVDIGMYFKIERHSNRLEFIDKVMHMIYKNGWKFSISNAYWGEKYAEHISQAKIVLHYSYVGDVPYRLFETTGSRSCFLTDTLGFGIETIFCSQKHFVEYGRELGNLEKTINWILENPEKREEIENAGYIHARNNYTWGILAEKSVVPAINEAMHKRRANI